MNDNDDPCTVQDLIDAYLSESDDLVPVSDFLYVADYFVATTKDPDARAIVRTLTTLARDVARTNRDAIDIANGDMRLMR